MAPGLPVVSSSARGDARLRALCDPAPDPPHERLPTPRASGRRAGRPRPALRRAAWAGPAGASARFAFADTTLLRDTLGLRFDRLFELADSLRLTPDTLRALSIRWGFVPSRLVELADSLRARVDSVGVILERERYNPLALRGESVTEFYYTTGYNVLRTRATWTNALDTRLVRDALFFSQKTGITFERNKTSRATALRDTRRAEHEIGYKIGKTTPLRGRAVLNRLNRRPSNVSQISDQMSQYQASPGPGTNRARARAS